ncbi:NADH:ubiquinone oxidoreductase subunit J [compost metagenome]
MLFGIMLSNRSMFSILTEQKNETHLFPVSVLSGTLLALVVLGGLLTLIWMGNIGQLSWMKNNVDSAHAYSGTENSANVLGVSFMTTYLLPLETISVYLLAVLVGAAYLARRKSRM